MTPTIQHLRHPYPMHVNVSAGQTSASRHGQGSDPINFCLDLVYKNLMGSDPPLTKFLRFEFLGAHQGGVGAVPGHELVVAAELDDAAVVDDGDAVRVLHGR